MQVAEVAALIAAMGGGAVLPAVVKGLAGWLSGRQVEERLFVQRAERDRRLLWEHAAHLRRMLIEYGVEPGELPAWPLDDTAPRGGA